MTHRASTAINKGDGDRPRTIPTKLAYTAQSARTIRDFPVRPKASSKPLELRFELEHFQSVPTGDAVAMLVRVYRK